MTGNERRILLVEDNMLIAMEMESLLLEDGCDVVGPVSNVADGLDAVRQTPLDGAVLDINLGDERVWPIAELLEQQGVPFLLTTGYDGTEVPGRFRERPRLEKPLTPAALREALVGLGVVDS